MQQRGELQRRRGGAHGTSVLLLVAALSPPATANIGANGGSGRAVGRRDRLRPDRAAPAVAHRIRQHARRSARRQLALRVRVAARGRQRSVRQRLLHAAGLGRADRVRRDAGGRGRGAPPGRHRPSATRWSAARRPAPGDQACLESFVRAFGRRAFRRPLTEDEVTRIPRAVGVRRRGQRLLRRRRAGAARRCCRIPSFLYRVEIGTAVAGQERPLSLDDYEIGARLSYFLWGSTPSDRLLDMAAAGALSTDPGVAPPRPSCSPIRAAPNASSSSTRSGWRTTSCR